MLFRIFSFVIKNRIAFMSGFFILTLILSAITIHYRGVKKGRDECVKAYQEAVLEQSRKETSAWANRPRSDRDAIARLRDEANRRRKNGSSI